MNNKETKNNKNFNKVLLTTLMVVVSLVSYNFGRLGRGDPNIAHAQNINGYNIASLPNGVSSDTMSQIKNLLDQKFISWKSSTTPPTTTDLENGMIKGYVEAYKDPYTVYFEPVESKIFADTVKGSFGGVGMQIASKDGRIVVIAPLKDTPAMKAGIKAGDILIAINGSSTEGLAVDKAVNLIRGVVGTHVKVKIIRATSTKELEFDLERQEIKVPSIDTKMVDGVFVINLYNFSGESSEQFRQALIKFSESKTDKLVLDIRGNPGGYLEAAVNMASFFLPEGKVIVSEKKGKNAEEINHRSRGFNVFTNKLKMVVLVDHGSASASEILAGALKDHGIATIVGKKTFGKGSVQELIDLCQVSITDGMLDKVISIGSSMSGSTSTSTEKCNKGSIKITVAKWYTPNGVNISEAGIDPDYNVDIDEALMIKSKKDTQLLKAISVVKGEKQSTSTLKVNKISKK